MQSVEIIKKSCFNLHQLKEIIQYFYNKTDYEVFSMINKRCGQVLLLFEENPIPYTEDMKVIFPNICIQHLYHYEEEHVFGMKKYIYHCEVSYSYYHEVHGNRIEFKKVVFNGLDRIRYGGQIPEGITDIGYKAFNGSNIQVVIMPDTVTSINNNAFENCNSLKTVYFSKNLLSIGAEAFLDCVSLKEINQPTALQFIGYHCFSGCISLKELPKEIKRSN
ncbi:leucine rich repeat protein bspa family [Entamoeba histolytica]|uniref:Leucine rich repeat protein bspa family n=5 Tax=Entamoeba histolytica TaxID=5759 RepID=C4LTK2_ENTH1|nr:hypothetical protein EHI_012090 [Entamoeba histolytica HM-1:IMSS]EAL50815.1 hypothetical protein EHI_012090 [Entamoeba histolytica HM-1:IMSS]EMD43256.1 leucine rich repeatcontaining protein BspA family protein [Entamoeba histolytica KU27]ENY61605.1 leucine rich repeat protein, bspa family protein [Entamoeba histolytica HM-1:IMSS-A]GAT91896.1 leucine rich repeat protein bspa family [Entamoeba histolytica]|eukprot:XP_656199.1 hypothetical protein EHI_012090 [Entamoeba histolytica HM-1:IMSS]